MNTIRIQQRGTLTLPKKIRESLDLKEGEVLSVQSENNTIILKRHETGEAELLRDIKKSLADIKKGKFIEFSSVAEFKKKLSAYDAD
jgi:AbrB family looped-hinge helix DNA binding protein